MRSFKLSLRGNVGIYHIVRIKNIEHGGGEMRGLTCTGKYKMIPGASI